MIQRKDSYKSAPDSLYISTSLAINQHQFNYKSAPD